MDYLTLWAMVVMFGILQIQYDNAAHFDMILHTTRQ